MPTNKVLAKQFGWSVEAADKVAEANFTKYNTNTDSKWNAKAAAQSLQHTIYCKNNKHIWKSIFGGYYCADLVAGIYCNHRKHATARAAFIAES